MSEQWRAAPLPDDERADLRIAFDTGWLTLLTHVTDLCDAYRAQGGDLAHDGTLRAQAEAEESDPRSVQCPNCRTWHVVWAARNCLSCGAVLP